MSNELSSTAQSAAEAHGVSQDDSTYGNEEPSVGKILWGIFHLIERRPALATGALVVLYILGFVISNVHLAQYKILTFDVVQGRYLAAGLSFLLFTPPPIIAGYMLGYVVFDPRRAKPVTRSERVGNIMMSLALVVVTFIGCYVLFTVISVQDRGVVNIAFAYYFSGCTFLGLLPSYTAWTEHRRDSEAEKRPSSGLELLILPLYLVLPLFLAVAFGMIVYPEISPVFGGGGAWIGRVHLAAGSTDGSHVHHPAAIIDRDDNFLTLIPCRRSVGDTIGRTPRMVSMESVESIVVEKLATVSACTNRKMVQVDSANVARKRSPSRRDTGDVVKSKRRVDTAPIGDTAEATRKREGQALRSDNN